MDLVNVNSKFHSKKEFKSKSIESALLQKIKLCANMFVKDVFISENFIAFRDLSKNMSFRKVTE